MSIFYKEKDSKSTTDYNSNQNNTYGGNVGPLKSVGDKTSVDSAYTYDKSGSNTSGSGTFNSNAKSAAKTAANVAGNAIQGAGKVVNALGSSNVLGSLDALSSGNTAANLSAAGSLAGLAVQGAGAAAQVGIGGVISLVSAGQYIKAKKKAEELLANNPEYAQSQELQDAIAGIQTMIDNPPEYADEYKGLVEERLDALMNRDDFNYDFTQDPTYQMYRDQYIREGKMAMQDTVADVAALSGGYGNSYAATAGSQAYQEYLSGLNDVIPELQNQAFERYQYEGQQLANQFEAARSIRSDDLNQWIQTVLNPYQEKIANAFQMASMLSDEEWTEYLYNQYNPWLQEVSYNENQMNNAAQYFMSGGQMMASGLTDFGSAVSGTANDLANLYYQNEANKREQEAFNLEMAAKYNDYELEYGMPYSNQSSVLDLIANGRGTASANVSSETTSGGGNDSTDDRTDDIIDKQYIDRSDALTYENVISYLKSEGIDAEIMTAAQWNEEMRRSNGPASGITYAQYLENMIDKYTKK